MLGPKSGPSITELSLARYACCFTCIRGVPPVVIGVRVRGLPGSRKRRPIDYVNLQVGYPHREQPISGFSGRLRKTSKTKRKKTVVRYQTLKKENRKETRSETGIIIIYV